MLNFQGIILFSEHPGELVDFYQKIFEREPDWRGGDFSGFALGSTHLVIGPHSKVKGENKNPERMMFNLETNEDIHEEFDRIKSLGAKVIAEPYQPAEEDQMWLATFADIDGNYFQLGTPMEPTQ